MPSIPFIVEKNGDYERVKDIYTRLLEDRIVFLSGAIGTESANAIIAQLLFLAADDPHKDIYMYINSPGGSVSDGLAIFDTMNYIKPDVSTICIGGAYSMGAFLLAAGAKGKRKATENSRIMIHQPLAGGQGQISDLEIIYKEGQRYKEKLTSYLAELTGKSYEEVSKDCDRDFYMTAEESVSYGLIDKIEKRAKTS